MSQAIIKSVNIESMKKGMSKWEQAEVTYSSNGETKHAKIMSFNAPEALLALKEAKDGDTYEFEWKKNDSGFLNIVGAKKLEGSAKTATAARSNYETADERAWRQALIVRQSSLAQAVAWCKGTDAALGEVIDTAEEFTRWVMDATEERSQNILDS